MKITLKQLQVFVNTAKTQSISLGAQDSFISQAAASMSLSQLEKALGITLFDRVGGRLKLNNDGENLLIKASYILNQVEELEDYSKNDDVVSGKMIIAASTTIANYILPKYIADFKSLYPQVDIEILTGNTKKIIGHVENFDCDIGFIEGYCDSEIINSVIWKKDSLKIICGADNPIVQKKSLKVADIIDKSWALREDGSGTSDIFLESISLHKKTLNKSITLNSSEAIKQYVANSDCFACMSEAILDRNSDDYTILNLEDFNVTRNFYTLLHTKKYQSHLVNKFQRFI